MISKPLSPTAAGSCGQLRRQEERGLRGLRKQADMLREAWAHAERKRTARKPSDRELLQLVIEIHTQELDNQGTQVGRRRIARHNRHNQRNPAKADQAKPSQTKPNQAKQSQTKPSQTRQGHSFGP